MRGWLVRLVVAAATVLGVAMAAAGGAGPSNAPDAPDKLLAVPALARIVDQPGVLAPADRAALEARLARFESDNGAQVAIVIVASTGIEPIEDFANRVGSSWKIGRHGIGDGLLLVIATQDRRARIEVARSLEGAIPDVIAKRVVQQTMGPHFKSGDYAGGLNAGLDELLTRIGQERLGMPPAQSTQPGSAHGSSPGRGFNALLPLLLVGLAFGSALRRIAGTGGALVAGIGAGAVGALLSSIAVGLILGVVVFVLAMAMGLRGGSGLGGPWFPGSWGGGSGGFGGGGGGGFRSGGGGDFSGGGASGDW